MTIYEAMNVITSEDVVSLHSSSAPRWVIVNTRNLIVNHVVTFSVIYSGPSQHQQCNLRDYKSMQGQIHRSPFSVEEHFVL